MKPASFPESNGTLSGGPAASYGTEDDVSDLPVHRADGQIISCWRLSWRDRLRLLFGGRVWLHVLARQTHAPVKVAAESPFIVGRSATRECEQSRSRVQLSWEEIDALLDMASRALAADEELAGRRARYVSCQGVGVSAQWCPECGTCTCPDKSDLNDERCPLHATRSLHCAPPIEDAEALARSAGEPLGIDERKA